MKSAPASVRRLSANSVYQIAGQVTPLIVAAGAIRVIYRHMDHADFGIFTLATSAIALFSIMDFGIARATVRFVSRALAEADTAEADRIAGQSLLGLGALSLLLMVVFVAVAPPVAVRWLRLAGAAGDSLRAVVYLLGFSIPFFGIACVFRSTLEARERFATVAVVQGLIGAGTYAVPMALSYFTEHIETLVAGAVVVRVLGLFVYWAATRGYWTIGPRGQASSSRYAREFRKFSGWLIVSNIVGNVILYSDRALLARFVPLGELPFYNVPLDFLSRLMILVNGAISVGFPVLSRISTDGVRMDRIQALASGSVAVCAAPLLLLCSAMAPVVLQLWLGTSFRVHSTEIVRILVIGLLFLGLNALSLASLYARGISGRVAFMHVTEAPLYIWALMHFGQEFGPLGIATVWTARMVYEFVGYSLMQASVSGNPLAQLIGASVGALQAVPLLLLAVHQYYLTAALLCVTIAGGTASWLFPALFRGRVAAARP